LAKKDELTTVAEQSVQERGKRKDVMAAHSLLLMLARAGTLVAPWWSRRRDSDLRKFWKENDYLSGAVYTFTSRIKTVPWRIVPKDMTVKAHVRHADEFEARLNELSDFGKGWMTLISKFVEDLLTQDNGAFLEVIGKGKPDGPIVGPAMGLAHLDSWRCQRTSNHEFPVVFTDTDGKRYKLHYTRVIMESQMPSPLAQMHDVGFCALSRCINNAQSLLDILIHKQEKLGSRPQRGLLLTGGGLDPDDVREAFRVSNQVMDDQLLQRYSKTVVVGHQELPDATLQLIELSGLPDGFNEEQSTTLGMAAIALAFGMDPRELWPAITGGVTRAEALIAHIKQRGKGLGETLLAIERHLGSKFLPPYLTFSFDFQDDEQDRQKAEIKNIRARRQVMMLEVGAMDSRTLREEQLADGDLTEAQFERMELRDGRLKDGTPVLTLFFNPDYSDLLDLGIDNPLDKQSNDATEVKWAINAAKATILEKMAGANPGEKKRLNEAMAALDKLLEMYGAEKETRAETERPTPATPEEGEETEPEELEEGIKQPPGEFTEEDLEVKANSIYAKTMKAISDAARRIRITRSS